MSHPLIASLGVASVLAALPAATFAADDIAMPAPTPFASTGMMQHSFRMLRIKTDPARSPHSASRPDAPASIWSWPRNGESPGTGASKLDGRRFEFH